MIKLVGILVILSVLSSALVACGADETGGGGSSSSSKSSSSSNSMASGGASSSTSVQSFSISSSNRTAPRDVLKEVSFYTGGGGGSECETDYSLEPTLYDDHNQLILSNFSPNEWVRLFVYRGGMEEWPDAPLIGWGEFQVGSNGRLVIDLVDNEFGLLYAVVGNMSGEVTPNNYRCEAQNFTESILSSNKEIYVTVITTGADRLNVRSGPGSDYGIVGKAPSGARLKVTGSTKQVGSELWWPVRLDDGTEGWVLGTWVRQE